MLSIPICLHSLSFHLFRSFLIFLDVVSSILIKKFKPLEKLQKQNRIDTPLPLIQVHNYQHFTMFASPIIFFVWNIWDQTTDVTLQMQVIMHSFSKNKDSLINNHNKTTKFRIFNVELILKRGHVIHFPNNILYSFLFFSVFVLEEIQKQVFYFIVLSWVSFNQG